MTPMPEANLQAPTLEARMTELEQAISLINERNRRVSLDKAWEVSLLRKAIGVENPLRNSLIPTSVYLVSTFSVSWLKSLWLRRQR